MDLRYLIVGWDGTVFAEQSPEESARRVSTECRCVGIAEVNVAKPQLGRSRQVGSVGLETEFFSKRVGRLILLGQSQ